MTMVITTVNVITCKKTISSQFREELIVAMNKITSQDEIIVQIIKNRNAVCFLFRELLFI